MSRLNDLLRQLEAKEPSLAKELRVEYDALADRRAFGLNFERHTPESVELPGRLVRRGDKVHVLPERGKNPTAENARLWRVTAIDRASGSATIESAGGVDKTAAFESTLMPLTELVVVAEFRDPIYPGLVSTGRVERGGDKPFHTVINAENFHALQTLLFTHRGKVDCIYIDPPYNSGARDWKYNNDYVEGDDLYRHSKWLAFMERRLLVAKELLNPDDSVLIVSIDEKEYLRLGLLLEQTFPDASVQMVSTVINPKGSSRGVGFRRADEYIFFVMLGEATPARLVLGPEWSASSRADATTDEVATIEPGWTSMMRRGSNSARTDRPKMFYPIYADPSGPRIVAVGEPLDQEVHAAPPMDGLIAILPIRTNGSEGRWQVSHTELLTRIEQGRIRLGRPTSYGYVVNYLPDGAYAEVLSERFQIEGRAEDGSIVATGVSADATRVAPTQWKIASHNASENGTALLGQFLPKRKFPFPKSLYAVEDALRFFVAAKPEAVVVDFFSGSGTTVHAVMRLNRQDGGKRIAIAVTNNEVGADEQRDLRLKGYRPGDPEWEKWGICEYVTKPRVEAAVRGRTPDGDLIKGNYRYVDEHPIADGFNENVEFLSLTYEAPLRVATNREFGAIAPLLWMRAGASGRRIEDVANGWDVADTYAVIADLDQSEDFLKAVAQQEAAGSRIGMAFIVTDDDRLFAAVCRELPAHTEALRLYEAYLRNFEIEAGRSVR